MSLIVLCSALRVTDSLVFVFLVRSCVHVPAPLVLQESHGLKLFTWVAAGTFVQNAAAAGDADAPAAAAAAVAADGPAPVTGSRGAFFGDGLSASNMGGGEEGLEAVVAEYPDALAVRAARATLPAAAQAAVSAVTRFDAAAMERLEQRLVRLSHACVLDYLTQVQRPDAEAQRALRCKSAAVVAVLNALASLTERQLRRHLPAFFHPALELVHCAGPDVRAALARLLSERLPPLLPFAVAPLPAYLPPLPQQQQQQQAAAQQPPPPAQ